MDPLNIFFLLKKTDDLKENSISKLNFLRKFSFKKEMIILFEVSSFFNAFFFFKFKIIFPILPPKGK